MDGTTQECGELSRITSFETIDLKLEIFKIVLPSNNGFPHKNTVNEQYMYFS